MAAFDWSVGSLFVPAPGAHPIVGVGFQPKALILVHTQDELLGAPPFGSGQKGGIGFSDDSGNNVAASWYSGDFSAASSQSTISNTHSMVALTSIAPGIVVLHNTFFVQSMDPDGFTINVDLFNGPMEMFYIAIGGTSVNAQAGEMLIDNVAADDVQALPFTPSLAFFLQGFPGRGFDPSIFAGKHYTFGATNGTEHYSNTVWRDAFSTGFSNRGHHEITTKPLHQRTGAGAVFMEADAQLNPNELRVVKNVVPSVDSTALYLALEGVGSKIGSFLADEAVNGTKAIAGVGFTPIGQMFMSAYTDGDAPGGAGPSANNDFAIGAQEGITPPAPGEAYCASWRGVDDYGDLGSTPFDATSFIDNAFYAGTIGGTEMEKFDVQSLDPDGFTIENKNLHSQDDNVYFIMMGEDIPVVSDICERGKRCTSNFGMAFGEYGVCSLDNPTPGFLYVPELSCIGIECAKLSATPVTSQELHYDLGPDYLDDFEIADILIIQGLRAWLNIDDPIQVRVQGADDVFFTFPDEEIIPVTLADLTGFECDTFVARFTTFLTPRRYWRVIIDTTTPMNFPLNAIALGKELRLERSPVYPARFRLLDEFTEAPRAPWQLNLSFEGILEIQKEEIDRRLIKFGDVSQVWLHDANDAVFFGNRIMRTFLTDSRIQVRNKNNQFDVDLTFEEVVYIK